MNNVTIKDIAREAGVSVATVSRIINNKGYVSTDLQQKVLRIIDDMGYYPNMMARGLKGESMKTIALLIADATNEYFGQITSAIEEAIRDYEYTLFVCNSLNEQATEYNYLRLLAEKQVDGIIVNASGLNNDYIVQLSHHIPVVLLHRRINDPAFKGDFIDADFGSSTYEFTMDLIAKGHRKIGLISGPLFLSSAYDRYVNFQAAMRTIGVEVTQEYRYFMEGPFTCEFGYSSTQKLLTLEDPPTALIIMHCETTIGALRYMKSHNVLVPEQISFSCPGNISHSDLFYVEPNYALPDTRAMGRRAGAMMIERIHKENKIVNREVCYMPTAIYGNSAGLYLEKSGTS